MSTISQNKKKVFWEVQFVADRAYNVHWRYGLDWEGMNIKRSRFYSGVESRFLLHFNYTDRRDEFHVYGRQEIANLTSGISLGTSSSQ